MVQNLDITVIVSLVALVLLSGVFVWRRSGDHDAEQDMDKRAFLSEIAALLDTVSKFDAVDVVADVGVSYLRLTQRGTTVGIVDAQRHGVVTLAALRNVVRWRKTARARWAYFVTEGSFSPEALDAAKRANVILVDGERLARLRRKAEEK